MVLVVAALVVGGCQFHPDPTEANFDVKVVNDTARTVVLTSCGTGDNLCKKKYGASTVKPGVTLPTVQTSVRNSNPLLVTTTGGTRLGCLPLYFDYNADGTVVHVSDVVPCAKHYTVLSEPEM